MAAEKGTGAITGITNFLFLAFILPGVMYLCIILVLFPFDSLKALFPKLEMGIDVAVGAIIFLGLAITSIAFAVEMPVRWFWQRIRGKAPDFGAFSGIIFRADREKELGWYFWQLWGQAIMHWNIAWGALLIYLVYKYVNGQLWPCGLWFYSWRDFTLIIILANFICRFMFVRWHNALMSKLVTESQNLAPDLPDTC